MTEDQIKAYLKSKGTQCPYCGDYNIDDSGNPAADVSLDGTPVTQEVFCSKCSRTWMDIYTLTSVKDCED